MDEGEEAAAVRERILAGVDRLFCAQGIKSVGVDAIAAELGISKKTLYSITSSFPPSAHPAEWLQ
jgi:AcrR family transcriptional regulator